MTSPQGTEIGRAYVVVNLDDQTDRDYQAIRAGLEGRPDIALGTSLALPDAADYERIKAVTEAKSDIQLKTSLDTRPALDGFQQMADSADSQSQRTQSSVSRMTGLSAAAWTSLGTLVSGPVVAAGLGVAAAGFLAVGVAAEKSSPQVQQAFSVLKTEGTDVLQSSFQAMTPIIVGSLNQWTAGIEGMQPDLTALAGAVAPSLGVLSSALLKAAQTDLPALTTALGQSTPMARTLATGIQQVADGFANFLTHLDFGAAETGLAALLRDLGQLESVLATVLNAVMPLGNAFLTSVVPAVESVVSAFANGLAPAIQGVSTAISALAPVLNFMSGPTALVLAGVVAFKGLQSATTALLPVFNSVSSAVTTYGNQLIGMVGGSNSAIGSFTLMTDAQKKQAVQAASNTLITAQQTSAQAANNLATLESAAAAQAGSVSEEQLAAARTAATEAAAAEASATTALTEATSASSFAFGPVGIAIGGVAAAMTLFSSNTSKASTSTDGLTQELQRLAAAAPSAAQGIIDSDPNLASMINRLTGMGVSYKDLTDAINGNVGAQDRITAAFNQAAGVSGKGVDSINSLSAAQQSAGDSGVQLGSKTQDLVTLFQQYQGAVDQARSSQQAANTVTGQGAQTVSLTAEQTASATAVAAQFGLSVGDVVSAFQKLPGAGQSGAAAVAQVTSKFTQDQVAVENAQQALTSYFQQLQQNADQANEAVANANHSYQQSIQSVADAQHSYVQAQQSVVDADQQVVSAHRAVTQAEQGVVDAEHSLAQAQQSEQQAQEALTQARADAVQQLKDLQLQLDDQVTAEQRARLELFQQQQTAAAAGVTPDNAQAILAQTTTAANLAQQQAALDLVSAQNQLADTLNTGVELRQKVNTAEQQGVNQNPSVVSAATQLANAQYQVAQAEQGVQRAQQAVVDAQAGVLAAERAVTDAVYNEQKARQAISDAIYNEQQALNAVRQAQQQATQANALNTTSLDLNTQAGRNNYAQLLTLFNAFPSWMDTTAKYNDMVNATATAFNGSKDAAAAFLKQEGLIPQDFKYNVTAVAQVDTSSYQNLMNTLIGGGSSSNQINTLGGLLGLPGHAEGGSIGGVGGPRDDSNLIWASKGEYMQPADAVQHYGVGFMEAVRTKSLPRGGDGASLPGYASGGLIGGSVELGVAGANYQANVNALTVMGLPHPAGLPEYVPPPTYTGINLAGINGSNRDVVLQVWRQFGWTSPDEVAATDYLLMRESGYNNLAQNPTSTAYGMFQFLNSTWGSYGISKTADPGLQSVAGGRYIQSRYGDPIGAAAHERAYNWYDQGGYMLNNPGINMTGKPEMVLPPTLTDTMNRLDTMVQAATGGGGGVQITNNIATVPMDPYETGKTVANEVLWALRS